MADRKIFHKTILTGGAADSLDNIDGADRGDGNPLQDLDAAFVMVSGALYAYLGDIDSGLAESSPDVIRPDTNAGDFRWIRNGVAGDHTQGTDQGLDTGGANAVTAAQVKSAVTASHPAGSDNQDFSGLMVKAQNLSDVGNAATAFGSIKQAATSSATGVSELAIASEVNAGTDEARVITPDALAGSNFGKKVVQIVVFDYGTDVATGNGKAYFVVPDELTGMNLVRVAASVVTAGTDTGSTTIAVYNLTDAAEMLSTLMAIEQGETSTRTSAAPGVIDTTHDDVVTGDVLRIDVDAVTAATAPKGLIVELVFQLP